MTAWSRADLADARFDGSGWSVGTLRGAHLALVGTPILAPPRPAIAAPASGPTLDAEARSAIAAILSALWTHGLIASE